ncbi:MlaD family protein [Sulfuriroseicoccus oceanibius]|uniref:MCE family protein n=1 Tax=Sulfuriroseicoccus oceanibius TaxID=2707525 RepID=A0A6B3LC36_9BACT|nr:MlaD family protein [Sulfuriroseicoccus oceanibius]QQL44522.1 MCE family protein [Sulfuriroseicoccus oceanibius]
MSSKANPTAIGIFVTGAIALGAFAILLIGSGQWLRSKQEFILYFRADANGLDVGSDVRIGGVAIGTVESISIELNPETGTKIVPVVVSIDEQNFTRLSPATADIDLGNPQHQREIIESGLRGRLRQNSILTGKLFVELDFLPDQEGFVFDSRHSREHPQIPTIPATMDAMMESISESLDAISSLNFTELFDEITKLVKVTEQRVAQLDTEEIKEGIVGTTDDIRRVLNDPELAQGLDDFKLAAAQIKELTTTLNSKAGPIADNLDQALAKADASMSKIEAAADGLAGLTAEDAPTIMRLNDAIAEIQRTSKAFRELADFLKRNPDAVLKGRD